MSTLPRDKNIGPLLGVEPMKALNDSRGLWVSHEDGAERHGYEDGASVILLYNKMNDEWDIYVPRYKDHMVRIEDDRWIILHTLECRVTGLENCVFNDYISSMVPPEDGIYRINKTLQDGLLSLGERLS